MITNPQPSTATFSGMWIPNVQIVMPSSTKKGILTARLLPWDAQGGGVMLNGGRNIQIMDLAATVANDAEVASVITTIQTTLARLSENKSGVQTLNVFAPDPAKPILCSVTFVSGTPYRINDCSTLMKTDSDFAQTFGHTMAKIAALAGCPIT